MIPELFKNYTNSQLDQLITASDNQILASIPRLLATPGAIFATLFHNGTAAADVHVTDMDEASSDASRPPPDTSIDVQSTPTDNHPRHPPTTYPELLG